MSKRWGTLRETVATTLVAAAMVVAAAATAPAATGDVPDALAPATTVVNPRCSFEESFADSWTRRNGTEHVIYQVDGNESFTCIAGSQWHAWRKPGGEWHQERTPFVGHLMAMTGERRSLYLMYADPEGVHLAKRSGGGEYRDLELLSPLGLGTHILPSGDLVLRDGKWWAVWTENRTPEGFGVTDLWQAKTLGADLDRTRVTDTPNEHDDLPALALRADRSAFMLWTANNADPSGPSYSRSGTSADGTWTSEQWDAGWLGAAGDVAVSRDGVVSVVWNRNRQLMYADDRSGSFVTEIAANDGGLPSVAATGGKVFIGMSAIPFRTHLLSRDATGGAWTDEVVTPDTDTLPLDIASNGGSATVYYSNFSKLLSRSTA